MPVHSFIRLWRVNKELMSIMLLLFLAYFVEILTILSPCILPVLPFVFARSDQPFRKSGLPLLAGIAVTFTLVASLATVGGGWAVRANQFGRIAALILFGVFGLTLLFSSLAERKGKYRRNTRYKFGDGAHCCCLPRVRCSSWPRVRRRSPSNRSPLLHELGRDAIRKDRVKLLIDWGQRMHS